MSPSLYVPGDGPLHRLPAGAKLAALAGLGVALFLVSSPIVLGAAALAAAGVVAATGVRLARLRGALAGVAIVVAIVVAANAWLAGWREAAAVGARIVALVLLGYALTLTTRTSDLLATLERLLAPLERIGLADAGKVALAVALVLRFVPELMKQAADIREARAARGLRVGPVALVVPMIVRVLRSADAIAEAIDARAYPPCKSPPTSAIPSSTGPGSADHDNA
ncbi:energy-coupling factor transporter transmembrane component T family protein [Salinarimonas rosea]|uniref:energy-coupling factor transporter transmembrane component T family protein n=1 Tax=Salinarimonas rosea TaxID=552063 RepID=UPI0004077A87|nr:energy-coupling factor transporter transmembrane protein EcfT [Salinarimonas rosea]